MKNKDAVIAKHKELVEHLSKLLHSYKYEVIDGNSKWQRLGLEISALESESEESEERKTAEEVLFKHTPWKPDEITFDQIIDAMHEFASQSLPEITDEEIEDRLQYENIPMGNLYKEGMIEGAKWYRNELKKRI